MSATLSNLPTTAEDQYIVESNGTGHEGWFPVGEISLISGSSGTGKTTWLLQVLDKISRGESIFGHNTTPRNYRVILHDRSLPSLRRTLKRMHLSYDIQKNVIRLDHTEQVIEPAVIVTRKLDENKDAQIVCVEGLDMWIPEGKSGDITVVSRTIDSLQRIAEERRIAIIGTLGCPKLRKHEQYEMQRDAIFGSVAWGRKVETIVYLELSNKKNSNSPRRCYVMPRNGPTEEYLLVFDNGQLVESQMPENPIPLKDISESKFYKYLEPLQPGARLKWSLEAGIGKAYFYREVNKAVELGLCFRQDHAFYKALQ